MSKKLTPKKIISGVMTALLACVFVFTLVCLCSVLLKTLRGGEASLFGYKMYHVESDSMTPTLQQGDMIISKTIKDYDQDRIDKLINVGDVITFQQTVKGIKINNTHRVVKDVYFDEEVGEYCVVTKGDKAGAPEDAPLPITNIKAKMVQKTTFLKDIYTFLGSTGGIAIALVLPMGLLLASTIFQLVQKIRTPAETTPVAPSKTKEELEEEIKRKAVEEYIKEKAVEEYLKQQEDNEEK